MCEAAWYGWMSVMSGVNEHVWDTGNASEDWEVRNFLKERILKSQLSKSNG